MAHPAFFWRGGASRGKSQSRRVTHTSLNNEFACPIQARRVSGDLSELRATSHECNVHRYTPPMPEAPNPAPITIRPARPEDVDGITRTYLESAEHHARLDTERGWPIFALRWQMWGLSQRRQSRTTHSGVISNTRHATARGVSIRRKPREKEYLSVCGTRRGTREDKAGPSTRRFRSSLRMTPQNKRSRGSPGSGKIQNKRSGA